MYSLLNDEGSRPTGSESFSAIAVSVQRQASGSDGLKRKEEELDEYIEGTLGILIRDKT